MISKKIVSVMIASILTICGSMTAFADSSETSSQSNSSTVSSDLKDDGSTYSNEDSESESTLTETDSQIYDHFENEADDSMIDYYEDEYYDTDGNATLINNQEIIYNSDDMQFISVTTKAGNVFYVLINYSDEDGVENVYFLNKVDDYDLYQLLYESDESETDPQKAAEDAALAANDKNSKAADNVTESTDAVTDIDSAGEATSKKTPVSGMTRNLLILLVCAALGAVIFFVILNSKKNNKGNVQASNEDFSFDEEDDDYINEDEEE